MIRCGKQDFKLFNLNVQRIHRFLLIFYVYDYDASL